MIDDEDEEDEEDEDEVDPDAPPSPTASPPSSPTLGTLKSRPTTLNLTTTVSQVHMHAHTQPPTLSHLKPDFAFCSPLIWEIMLTSLSFSLSLSGLTEQQQQSFSKEGQLAGLSTQPYLTG